MKTKFVVSFSGGKDSILSLAKAIESGSEPVALMNTSREENTSWFHGIPNDLLLSVAKNVEIPLEIIRTKGGDDYSSDFESALKKFIKNDNIDTCVFGDIDIQSHRDWCEDRCRPLGLKAEFPLWQQNRLAVVKEFINKGFKAIIIVVNTKMLPAEFLGKELTLEVVSEIEKHGADPCGENGEYHTFVYDGPIFKSPVKFSLSSMEKIDHYVVSRPYLD